MIDDMMPSSSKPRVPKAVLTGAVILFALALLTFGGVRYYQMSQEIQKLKTSPQDQAKTEIERLVAEVRKLISVPGDELPTVATVSDPEKLKANAFFAQAMVGDKVLIYTQAKKAILYRPGENKVIEVAPLSIGTSSATPVTQEVRFFLYNGSGVTGLTKKYETELKTKVPAAVVVDRDNADKSDYEKSILVDLTSNRSAEAAELATTLGLEVSTLPAGETKPTDGDFLIILGSDKK